MNTLKKIFFFLSIIVLFFALSLGAQAAVKLPTKKPVKKTPVHVVKKVTKKVIKPTIVKKTAPVVKKPTTPVVKKPALPTPPVKTPVLLPPPKNTMPPVILPPVVITTTTKPVVLSTTTLVTTTTTAIPTSIYPWHDNILATQFYIGETGQSGTTAWDCHAVNHYGGIDSPFGRNGYLPTFTPKENPFYLALPYTDIGQDGAHKKDIPWYDAKLDTGSGYSFVKNRWVQLKRGDKVCYGQYEDSLTPDILDATGKRTGYGTPNHFDYVFGSAPATHPGIDVSPALSTCLGMYDATDKVYAHSDAPISWKFVETNEVPAGDWKNIITATPVSWENCN